MNFCSTFSWCQTTKISKKLRKPSLQSYNSATYADCHSTPYRMKRPLSLYSFSFLWLARAQWRLCQSLYQLKPGFPGNSTDPQPISVMIFPGSVQMHGFTEKAGQNACRENFLGIWDFPRSRQHTYLLPPLKNFRVLLASKHCSQNIVDIPNHANLFSQECNTSL